MITSLEIPDVKVITPRIFRDDRGFFSETYNQQALAQQGLNEVFVQDNHSMSTERNVVRGLHFQIPPHAQGKLVRVTHGAVFDVAVDIRRGSPTFGQHVSRLISSENWEQIWVPIGFAHGFCTLEPNTEVIYKVTDVYAPDCDLGLAWNDPALDIPWPIDEDKAILSKKDQSQPRLADFSDYFEY